MSEIDEENEGAAAAGGHEASGADNKLLKMKSKASSSKSKVRAPPGSGLKKMNGKGQIMMSNLRIKLMK